MSDLADAEILATGVRVDNLFFPWSSVSYVTL